MLTPDIDTVYRTAPLCGVVSPRRGFEAYVRMALIHEMRASQAALSADDTPEPKNTNVFFVTMSRQNVSALLKAVQRLEHYWAGAASVATILEKRGCQTEDSL